MKANKFAKNDEGVSAVIGVILMVAITVILAAVIAAFVFGMVGGVGNKKNPAFTLKRISNDEIQITLQDMGGAKSIQGLGITQPTLTDTDNVKLGTEVVTISASTGTTLTVGDTIDITDSGVAGTVHVVATSLVDGNSQVVIDTTI